MPALSSLGWRGKDEAEQVVMPKAGEAIAPLVMEQQMFKSMLADFVLLGMCPRSL